MIRSVTAFLVPMIVAATLIASAQPARADIVYSLVDDWSDTSNTNGPWSYNAAPGVPLANRIANWIPGQSVLAYSARPDDFIPFFMKRVNAAAAPDDIPAGRIYMHPNDGNSPPGLANATAGISWISPVAGLATVSGDLWEGSRYLGRDLNWGLSLNGAPLTAGVLHSFDPFSSSSPDSFSNGSGGASALTFQVSAGDVVLFSLTRGSRAGTYAGVDETISIATPSITTTPVPSSLVMSSILFGIFAVIWSYKRLKQTTVAA